MRAYSVNPGIVTTEAVSATLGDAGTLVQRYGAMSPDKVAQALLWLATSEEAPAMAKGQDMLDLQALIRTLGLSPPPVPNAS